MKKQATAAPAEPRESVIKRLKGAFICGLFFTAAILFLWFLFVKSLKSVGIALIIAIAVSVALGIFTGCFLENKGKLMKVFCTALALIFNLLLCFSVLVYTLAPSMIFHPHFDEKSYTALQAYDNAEKLTLQTAGGAISGWFLHHAEKSAPLILYFGGNGENSSTRMLSLLSNPSALSVFDGFNIAFLDYPGYGKTPGTPSEASLKQFGLKTFDALAKRADVDPQSIVIFGYSIGTGVANYVASQRNVKGLMLMAPYADGYDLYNGTLNLFYGPARLLVAYRMEAIKFAETISVKPLIFATEKDELVPYKSSVRLSKKYPAGCEFVTIHGITHGGFWNAPQVLADITTYLNEVKAK